jgi:hypothetical protein
MSIALVVEQTENASARRLRRLLVRSSAIIAVLGHSSKASTSRPIEACGSMGSGWLRGQASMAGAATVDPTPIGSSKQKTPARWPQSRLVRNPGSHGLGPKSNLICGNVFSELKEEIHSFAGRDRSIDDMDDLVREARLVWFF